MVKINKNYLNLKDSYLFSTIAKKVNEYKSNNPNKKVISLGIGDVVLPLSEPVISELEAGVKDMAKSETFKGYGPEQGYAFLREELKKYYSEFNVDLDADEIFISDGAKSDLGNMLDIFSKDNKVLIPDPVYPVYVDTNIMDGREIIFMDSNEKNNFLAMPDYSIKADLIYICSPNNPTGAAYNRNQLKAWVEYAKEVGAVILYDAAYEAFISEDNIPHSIYEIPGAKECAIEVCSLSKTAGFTGLRCGYVVIPKELKGFTKDGREVSVSKLWNRRTCTKFNGVPYITQRAAEAIYTEEGKRQIEENINYYLENAKIIKQGLEEAEYEVYGGINSPYIWLKIPEGITSWEFFDKLLEEANVVGTPGSGFGLHGEGYFRLTAFNTKENTIKAIERIKKLNR